MYVTVNYPIDSFSFSGDIVMQDRFASACQHAPSPTDRPAFYPLAQFPRLQELALNWEVIRDECMNLDAPLLEIDRVGKNHDQVHAEIIDHVRKGGRYGWLLGWKSDGSFNRDWTQYGLVVRDQAIPFAAEAMPRTIEMLGGIKGIKVCALSRMMPNVLLSTHRHPELLEQGMLQMHITLDAAAEGNYAYLNVAGHFNQNQVGNAIVFDGSLDHFALNASPVPRTIFYMEFERDKQIQG